VAKALAPEVTVNSVMPGPVLAPGVYDCISAKVVERAGFDAAFVSGVKSFRHLNGKIDRFLQFERLFLDPLLQSFPFDIFHRDEMFFHPERRRQRRRSRGVFVFRLIDLIDGGNVLMRQRCRGAGFLHKTCLVRL